MFLVNGEFPFSFIHVSSIINGHFKLLDVNQMFKCWPKSKFMKTSTQIIKKTDKAVICTILCIRMCAIPLYYFFFNYNKRIIKFWPYSIYRTLCCRNTWKKMHIRNLFTKYLGMFD